MEIKAQVYSLSLRDYRTYLSASLFIVGNILLPMLCHMIPQGGLTFLPIYFFTLVGAYKYGLSVGLLTAILSPLVNSLLTGMPPVAVLPSILIKSTLIALIASFVAGYTKKVSFLAILAVVLSYQLIGSCIESIMHSDWTRGFQDFRIGVPGIIIQIVGGYLIAKRLK